MAKEFHIDVTRVQKSNGKFHRVANITRQERLGGRPEGLIHKAVNFAGNVNGDLPSLTKYINNFQPQTFKGQAGKLTAKAALFTTKKNGSVIVKSAMAAETLAIGGAKAAGRKALSEAEWRVKTSGDAGKGALLAAKFTAHTLSAGGGLGKVPLKTVQNFKKFKSLNNEFKLKKKQYKSFKKGDYKLKIEKSKTSLEIAKLKKDKKAVKRLKLNKKSLNNQIKIQKAQLKASHKQVKNARKLSNPIRLTGGVVVNEAKKLSWQMQASVHQKLVHSDDKNDLVRGANVIAQGNKAAVKSVKATSKLLKKAHKPRLERLDQKSKKLMKKKNKLGKKKSLLKNKHYKKSSSVKGLVAINSKLLKAFKPAIGVVGFLSSGFFIIWLMLFLFVMILASVFGNSGWVMGTYTAMDYELTKAESYYTKKAYEYNENVCNTPKTRMGTALWDNTLKYFGYSSDDVDCVDKKGKPNKFDYIGTANYDFDPEKLWSFISAYYYDFSEKKEDEKSDEIKYWEYNSDVEKLIDELLADEYEYKYDCQGKSWKVLDNYEYHEFYSVKNDTVEFQHGKWTYRFKPENYPNEFKSYIKDGYLYIDNFFRVLNANDSFADTEYMLYNNCQYADDEKKDRSPIYQTNSYGNYGYYKDGSFHERTAVTANGQDCYFLISGTDSSDVLNNGNGKIFYGYYKMYYWDDNVTFSYGLYQKKTFDEVIEDKLKNMDNGDERLNYYRQFLGTDEDSNTTHGNHQLLKNILEGDSLHDYLSDNNSYLHWYGYDMYKWGETHCKMDDKEHNGLDICYSSGSKLYAPASNCKIKSYDKDKKVIKLFMDNLEYWYDKDTRDTEIIICNAELINDKKEGDILNERECFAQSTNTRKCDGTDNDRGKDYIHIMAYIDTDGIGSNYIDPRLIFY